MTSRPRSDGFRITKVGSWFVIFLVVVLLAATNTGNNGLFLVLAVMGAALLASQLVAARNVRGLAIEVTPPLEVFAHRPARLAVTVKNRGRWLPRWLLIFAVDPADVEPRLERRQCRTHPLLVPYLGPRRRVRNRIELLMRRRGRHRLRSVAVSSLFPLGFFRKGMRYPVELELLVFPEIFAPSASRSVRTGRAGEEASRRVGWGHDLHGLRPFRHGDDPRSIHWKQSARTGDLVFQERETEENRRLMLIFDNAVGEPEDDADRRRFEQLVSETATAALDHLSAGYEVALLTRGGYLPFTGGARQRRRILETLALIEPEPEEGRPLQAPERGAPEMRLGREPRREVA